VTSPSKSREAAIYRGNARLADAPARTSVLIRLCTDFGLMRRIIRYSLGLPVPMETEDRRVLEQVIFPEILRLPDTVRILFVGCDWYTKHYERMYFGGRDYWTVDISPKARKFGGRQHRVTPLEGLDAHFAPQSLDVIFCNGVFGFGLDEAPAIERAIDMCCSRLRVGGYFIFGWDDIPARTPVPLDSIAAFGRLQHFPLPALDTWRCLTDTPYRHTYDFYRRSEA
jgi:SAM-dependent methyltransferase